MRVYACVVVSNSCALITNSVYKKKKTEKRRSPKYNFQHLLLKFEIYEVVCPNIINNDNCINGIYLLYCYHHRHHQSPILVNNVNIIKGRNGDATEMLFKSIAMDNARAKSPCQVVLLSNCSFLCHCQNG